jgi:lincosamide nucleotidyltransferase A/C/D/E
MKKRWNFVIIDDLGREIDVHTVTFNESGDGTYGPQGDPDNISESYPAASFLGKGFINGREVKCLTADYQVISHTGYELDENDFKDVFALHERFDVPLPDEYKTK